MSSAHEVGMLMDSAVKTLAKCESMRIDFDVSTQMFIDLYACIENASKALAVSRGSSDIVGFLEQSGSPELKSAASHLSRYRMMISLHERTSAPISPHLARESIKFARKFVPIAGRMLNSS